MKIMCKALLVFIQNHQFLLHLKASAWELSDYENQHGIPEWALYRYSRSALKTVYSEFCILLHDSGEMGILPQNQRKKFVFRDSAQFWIWFWSCRCLKSDLELYCQVNRSPRGVRLAQTDLIFRSVGYIKACLLHMACMLFWRCLTCFKFL